MNTNWWSLTCASIILWWIFGVEDTLTYSNCTFPIHRSTITNTINTRRLSITVSPKYYFRLNKPRRIIAQYGICAKIDKEKKMPEKLISTKFTWMKKGPFSWAHDSWVTQILFYSTNFLLNNRKNKKIKNCARLRLSRTQWPCKTESDVIVFHIFYLCLMTELLAPRWGSECCVWSMALLYKRIANTKYVIQSRNRSFYVISMKTIVSNSLPFHQKRIRSNNNDDKKKGNGWNGIRIFVIRCWPRLEMENFTEKKKFRIQTERARMGGGMGMYGKGEKNTALSFQIELSSGVCCCTVHTLHMWYAKNFYGQLSTELRLIFDLPGRDTERKRVWFERSMSTVECDSIKSVYKLWTVEDMAIAMAVFYIVRDAPNYVTVILHTIRLYVHRICFVFVSCMLRNVRIHKRDTK